VAKRCVLEQKLLLGAYRKSYLYEKSIGTEMDDLDLRLEGVSRSCQPSRGIGLSPLNISKSKTVRDRGLVPKDHAPIGNGTWVINQMVT